MEKGVVDAPTGAAMEGTGDDVCVFQAVILRGSLRFLI